MKLFKKISAFLLILAMMAGAQAMGLNPASIYARLSGGGVSKNHSGIELQSVDTKLVNPDYVSLESGILERNSRQKVTVGLSLDMTNVSEASLKYKLEGSDQEFMQSSSDIENGYIAFDINVDSVASLGKYSLSDVQLKSKDGSTLNSINMKDMAVSYEVVADKSVAAESAQEAGNAVSGKISDTSAVVGVDDNNSITGEDIGKAIDNANKAMKNETAQPAASNIQGTAANDVKAASGVTIILDPGHGGNDPGAVSGSYQEKTLNMKIAQYAKEELDTYAGVTVGLTKTTDINPTLPERADAAQQQGAGILVSLHNNSSGGYGTMSGAEVYVSVLKAYNEASTKLGNLIMDQLTSLGLYDRGVKVRKTENGNIFTLTGELADYYGIIRESAYRGFPGIIIEHCFLDNAAEADKYLSSEAKLKQLGVADAKALADYYGLVKKDAAGTPTVNLAQGKLASASSSDFKNLSLVTDGNKATENYTDSYPDTGLQWIQMDLGDTYDVNCVKLWHYFGDARKYKDVVIQISEDPTFATGVRTVYNNDNDNSAGLGTGYDYEYAETSYGKTIQFSKVRGRYVRFYSSGSSINGNSHYVEVEIYGSKVVHPTSVSLNKTTMKLSEGTTDTLTAVVTPQDTTDKGVAWSSSDTRVATVSSTGVVTGVTAGTATITVSTTDGNLKTTCDVTVAAAPRNLAAGKQFTSPVFTNLPMITDGGKSTSSFAEDYPYGGGLQYVQLDLGDYYDLSDIKLWHYYGDGRKYKDVAVQVSTDPAFATDVTTVYNNDADNSAKLGTGTNSEYAENIAGLDIRFGTVNARYVRLYSNGSNMNSNNHYVEAEVYGLKGEAVHPAGVSLSKATMKLVEGATDTLTAAVMPLNATDKSVTWSSSDESVATVSSGGTVKGVKAGTATITAATADGNLTATCTVTVTAAPRNLAAGKQFTASVFTNLSLVTDGSKSTGSFAEDYPAGGGLQYVQLDLGAYFDLSDIKLWHYYADGRKYHDVIVQISNDPAFSTDVTTVYNNDADNSAKLGAGTNSEYAETSAGRDITFDAVNARYVRLYSNGSNINVSNHYVEAEVYGVEGPVVNPAAVSLNKSADTLAAGASDTLTANVMPLNTTDKSVTWSSDNTNVATVSSNGVVTGVAAGTATITASTAENGLKASCTVTVTAAPAKSNLAAGKLFTASAFSNLKLITDGSKNTNGYTDDYPASGLQYVQVDLGGNFDINDIKLWHYFGDGRKYHDVIVQVSNDPTFNTGVKTVFNNDTNNSAARGSGANGEYAETSSGLDISLDAVNGRYVRFYSNGNTVNNNNHYVEIEIYGGKSTTVSNQAAGKSMTSSVRFLNLSKAADGNKLTSNYVDCYPAEGLQWIQVDLGICYDVSGIKLWHYFGDSRMYHDVIVQVSNDPTFATGVTRVYSNDADNSAKLGSGTDKEYAETSSGLNIIFDSVNARYVRFYSNGNTANGNNHYVELEVYGK